jgi:hypothetical protein
MISARMMRSPSSASAISRARSRSGGMMGSCVRHCWTPGQLRELAQELAGPVGDDGDALAGLVAVSDLDLTRQDNHEAGTDVADGGERLAGGERAALAEATHPLDLQRIEHRQHLRAALI